MNIFPVKSIKSLNEMFTETKKKSFQMLVGLGLIIKNQQLAICQGQANKTDFHGFISYIF